MQINEVHRINERRERRSPEMVGCCGFGGEGGVEFKSHDLNFKRDKICFATI